MGRHLYIENHTQADLSGQLHVEVRLLLLLGNENLFCFVFIVV